MPFEPLRTDEKLDKPVKAAQDMDAAMMVGCTGFVLASMVCYGLSVWPFFVFDKTHLAKTLLTCGLTGFLPSALFGIFCARRFGLAGGMGFIGGALTTCVFTFLRLQSTSSQRFNRDLPQPDFPESWVWMIPLAWFIVALILAALTIPRKEYEPEPREKPTNDR